MYNQKNRLKLQKNNHLNEITTLGKRVEVIEKTKKPLQFPIKIATFRADEVLSKRYHTHLIFLLLIEYLNMKRLLLRIIF